MVFRRTSSEARPHAPVARSAPTSRKNPGYWLDIYEKTKPRLGVVRMGNLISAAKHHLDNKGFQQFRKQLFNRIYGASNSTRSLQLWDSRVQNIILTADRYCRALAIYTFKPSPYLRVMAHRRPPGARGPTARRSKRIAKAWCPLCCNYYSPQQMNKEHVPPHSLGGIRRLKICRSCNALTGIYDNYTVQSLRASSSPLDSDVRVSIRPLHAKDDVTASESGHLLTVAIASEPAWQTITASKKTVDTLQDDSNTLRLLASGAGQELGLPVPAGSPFLVRIDTLDYVTSYVKAAYLLVVLLLGRLGPSYARWSDAVRCLLAGTGRYRGEPTTAGGDVGRYVPVVKNPWPDKANRIGFSLRHRLWFVIVRNRLVVLPSYDPKHSCQEALFLRKLFLPLDEHTIPAGEQLMPRNPNHVRWFAYPRSYGSPDVKYIRAPRDQLSTARDLVGSVIRAPATRSRHKDTKRTDSQYTHYVVIHQRGSSLAVAEVEKDTWQDFCFEWSTKSLGESAFDRPYPTNLQQRYPDSVAQNRPFPVRQHYRYCVVK